MILVKVHYQATVHVRTPTCGGMDSEFSHREIQVLEYGFVVPDDGWGKLNAYWDNYVREHVKHCGGNDRDPNFKIHSLEVHRVDAVYQPPITMIR